MDENVLYKFNEGDEKIVDLLSQLGMPKTHAKTLIYFSHVPECQSVNIERGAYLRQPEVSCAISEFESKGWIQKRSVKKEGKGRPIFLYQMTTQIPKILDQIEKEKYIEFEKNKIYLNEIKNYFNIQ